MSDTNTTVNLEAEIARLKAENAELKKKHDAPVSCKVSQKGGVSVYGLGRFPVTLYTSQWNRLLAARGKIAAFIVANQDKMEFKDKDVHDADIRALTDMSETEAE